MIKSERNKSGVTIITLKATTMDGEFRYYQIDSQASNVKLKAYGDIEENKGIDLDDIRAFLNSVGGVREAFRQYSENQTVLPKNADVKVKPLPMKEGVSNNVKSLELTYTDSQGVTESELTGKIADLGITLLLFTVGLKLNVQTLARPQVWAVTTIHMAIVVAVLGLILYALSIAGAWPNRHFQSQSVRGGTGRAGTSGDPRLSETARRIESRDDLGATPDIDPPAGETPGAQRHRDPEILVERFQG